MTIDGTQPAGVAAKSRISVLLTETRCVGKTLALLARKEIALPVENRGRSVVFADGSRSEVYRETAMRRRRYEGLVLIAVRFRLRLIGSSRLAHMLFRFESLFNTLLFAAHRGFQTKLWLTDRETGYYRGIYEWEGRDAAIDYAETLRVVLRPWVQAGSFAYQVIEDRSRDRYLEGVTPDEMSAARDGWWLPVQSLGVTAHGTR
jgi:hypothetical protein